MFMIGPVSDRGPDPAHGRIARIRLYIACGSITRASTRVVDLGAGCGCHRIRSRWTLVSPGRGSDLALEGSKPRVLRFRLRGTRKSRLGAAAYSFVGSRAAALPVSSSPPHAVGAYAEGSTICDHRSLRY